MKLIGKIHTYNGEYGTIMTKLGLVDFENKDISFKQPLKVNDIVEFRVEFRYSSIMLARNITKIDYTN